MTFRTHSLVAIAVVVGACTEAPAPTALIPDQPLLAASAGAYVPGEQQPLMDATNAVGIMENGVGPILAQTFTQRASASLGYLQLPVACLGSTLLNVRIREGLGGRILYQVNAAGLPRTLSNTMSTIQVYDPATMGRGIRLRKGTQYAFELAAVRGSPTDFSASCGIAKGPDGNSYNGGRSYAWDPRFVTSWVPRPNGSPADDEDLPFITLVR
ncbi:MAG TPA: hypothetical protein VFV33_19570 [Gemmatimonadaceae bacterium]|nr:hypothetical protein [Gemmatimonadaceae bacterium]